MEALRARLWLWGPVLLAALAFSTALPGGFLMIDDDWLVSENPWILHPTREDLGTILDPRVPREVLGNEWLPLRDLSYTLDAIVWRAGKAVLGWQFDMSRICRLTQIALYAADTGLVALLLAGLTGRTSWAGLAAAVFALHPVHAEAVSWISSRKDLLGTLFVLLSVLGYRRGGAGAYLLAWLSFVLALLCKVPMAVLPGLLVATDLFYPRSGRWGLRDGLRVLPFALLAVPFMAVHLAKARHGLIGTEFPGIGPREHRLTMLGVAVDYAGLLLWPLWGRPNYRRLWSLDWGLREITGALLVAALLGLLAWAVWSAWRGRLGAGARAAGWGLAWAAAAMVPASGLFARSAVLIADRYLFLPSVGLALAAAVGLSGLRGRRAGAVAVLLLLAWGLRDWGTGPHWRSTRSIAWSNLRQDPIDSFSKGVPARLAAFEGDWPRAVRDYLKSELLTEVPHQKALTLIRARVDSILALAQTGRLEEAGRRLSSALAKDPDHFELLALKGRLAMLAGDLAAAEAAYARNARQAPWLAAHWIDYGICLSSLRRPAEVAAAFERAAPLSPKNPALRSLQGLALLSLGRIDEAEAAAREAAPLVERLGAGQRALADLRLAISRAGLSAGRPPVWGRGLVAQAEAVTGPTVESEALHGEWALQARDGAEAERRFRRALSMRREDSIMTRLGELLRARGVQASLRGDLEGAWEAYRAALAAFPPGIDTSGVSAHLEAVSGPLLRRRFEAAAAAFESGDLEGARRGFRGALEVEPSFFEARYDLGLACEALGAWEEARTAFEEAVRLRPDDAEAARRLSAVRARLAP